MPENQICTVKVDGKKLVGPAGKPLIDFLADNDIDLPHICYEPTLGPIETCDTCWVEVNGELNRGCSLKAEDGLDIDMSGETSEGPARRCRPHRRPARTLLFRL